MAELEFTGERVVPGKVGALLWSEHMARYLLAADFVKAQVVLDAGSGAGYGTELLAARGAKSILGIDLAEDAIAYARDQYRRTNLEYRVMDVADLRLADQTFDVVVSFEVIEHLTEQEKFVAGIARVLKADGLFLVSTPNRSVYRQGEEPNPFHTREFTLEEFSQLLIGYFRHVRILGQSHFAGILLRPVSENPPLTEDLRIDHSLVPAPRAPLYFLAVCSNAPFGHTGPARRLIHFSDRIEPAGAWQPQLEQAIQELKALVPEGDTFILVDEEQWGVGETVAGRRHLPFPERGGQYWGRPEDDEAAVREFERLRQAGASFMVFGWPAFWWLEYYEGLRCHMRSNFSCVLENERLVVFDLRTAPAPRPDRGSQLGVRE
jgi:SAM-dependent methyltransferase